MPCLRSCPSNVSSRPACLLNLAGISSQEAEQAGRLAALSRVLNHYQQALSLQLVPGDGA